MDNRILKLLKTQFSAGTEKGDGHENEEFQKSRPSRENFPYGAL